MMPARTYWIREPWIMGVDYVGAITKEEIETVMEDCLQQVEKQRIYFLIDTSGLTSVPRELLKLGPMLRFLHHPNPHWLVFVGIQNPMVSFAIRLLVHKEVKLYASRDEAMKFLEGVLQADQVS
jgi:hypothetical protein